MHTVLWLFAALFLACRATDPRPSHEGLPHRSPTTPTASTVAAPPAHAATPSTVAGTFSSSDPTSSVASAAPGTAVPAQNIVLPGLPLLHPIVTEPFPAGVSKEVLCAAIDAPKGQHLWTRFGHFLPLWAFGTIFVFEASPEAMERVVGYVLNDYVSVARSFVHWGHCDTRVVAFVEYLREDQEWQGNRFGATHLSEMLLERFGVRTLETFGLRYNDDDMLARYCRADAEVCDRLLQLTWHGSHYGVCDRAVNDCGTNNSSPNWEKAMEACRRVPKAELACRYYASKSDESRDCRRKVKAALCPSGRIE